VSLELSELARSEITRQFCNEIVIYEVLWKVCETDPGLVLVVAWAERERERETD
jgi:hypothetical protein